MHEFIISPIFNLKAIGVEISEVIHKRILFIGEHHCSASLHSGLPGAVCFPGAMVAYQLHYVTIPVALAGIGVILHLLAAVRF
jgi:hypothetical protein